MITIHYKSEIWNKAEIDETLFDANTIIKRLEDGETIWDLYNDDTCQEMEPILDTEELLSTEENDGQPTIEVYDCDNCSPIWTNEIKKYEKVK